MEHRVARLREDFGFSTCTRCTTHPEALGISGLDAEMVPHAGRVLWEGFRPAVDLQGTDGPPPDLADLSLD